MASETTQSPPILFTIQNLPYSPQKACEYWFLETKVLVGGACISFPVPTEHTRPGWGGGQNPQNLFIKKLYLFLHV